MSQRKDIELSDMENVKGCNTDEFAKQKYQSVSSQARRELNPSHMSKLSLHQREPQEVEDTCISWRFSNRSAEQIIRNGS